MSSKQTYPTFKKKRENYDTRDKKNKNKNNSSHAQSACDKASI